MSVRGFAAAVERATGYEVSHSSVAQYESGRTVPADYVAAVARTFDVNPAWLLGTQAQEIETEPEVARRAFEEMTDVVDRYRPVASAAEADLRCFFELSDFLFSVSSNDYFVRLNDAWLRVLGYDRETLMNTPLLEFVHPDDRTRAEEAYVRAWAGGDIKGIRVRWRHADGTSIWLSCNCRGIGGRVYSVCEDVTALIEKEETLRQEAETLRRVIGYCPHGVLVHQGGRILLCNPAAARILGGGTPEKLEGTSLWRFVPPEDQGLLEGGQSSPHGQHGSPFRALGMVTKNGGRRSVQVAAVPVVLGGERVTQVVLYPHEWVAGHSK